MRLLANQELHTQLVHTCCNATETYATFGDTLLPFAVKHRS